MNHPQELQANAALGQDPCGHGGCEAGGHPARGSRWLLPASVVLAVAAELWALCQGAESTSVVATLSVAAILLGGIPTLLGGLRSLVALRLDIQFLMTLAVLGAFVIGEYPEAAVVVVLFAIAERIEERTVTRAQNAVRSLMTLSPPTATVADATGQWVESSVSEVQAGATMLVRPGERFALDGVVADGESAVNQAAITGESLPVEKRPGDKVFAGSMNGQGALRVTTTGGVDQTTLARIVRSVQQAQAQRAPLQRFIDSFARIYTPVVVGVATLVALLPWLAFGAVFEPWLYRALVLLVIACPCALVVSTPVAIASGLTAAARAGIVVKGGIYLERGATLACIALDKTGTITAGTPALTDVIPQGDRDRDEVLRLAASIEASSEHPVARALVSACKADLMPVTGFVALTGRGVSGVVAGTEYLVGNHRLVEATGVCSPAIEQQLQVLEQQGKTCLVLMSRDSALAIFAVADRVRSTSPAAVTALQALGVHPVVLSGDNQRTTTAVAGQVGIDDARGELLPDDKLQAIAALQVKHGTVGMVGDGINDAPALARADVSFAMGAAGSDTALETAGVALMADDLRGLPAFLRISRAARQVLRQNIAVALATKFVFFALALAGFATLWAAVVADMGASLAVVANSLRLLRLPLTEESQGNIGVET
ncbi:MAG: heavy metal translocating P-type ATPase [Planctomycetes bacterium]|nr:heavy metal translocating P-type ATPase [Planctomycetota bacterium]